MTKIDINEVLFKHLKEDYENSKEKSEHHKQFIVGFDYIEALVKLTGSIMISVVKSQDENLYNKIIQNNFQLFPSLGNFVNLIIQPLSKENRKKLKGEALYDFLDALVEKDKKSGQYAQIVPILEGNYTPKEHNKNIKTTKNLLENCITHFRNKTKGHGASFRDEDSTFRENILGIMDAIIVTLEKDYETMYSKLEFFIDENTKVKEQQIFVKYENKTYPIVPVIAYIGCDHLRCKEHKLHKLFFYNGGKVTRPEYLDHSFSHSSLVAGNSNFHYTISDFQHQIIKSKKIELLTDFVGREKELQDVFEQLITHSTTLIKVYGKPGIGKSAFLTQLESQLHENKLPMNTFIFYAMKDKMDVEEDKYFFMQINAYFNSLGIYVEFKDKETIAEKVKKLFMAYEKSEETKKILLMIDGLDEFASVAMIIKLLPLSIASKIQMIWSYRPVKNIEHEIKIKTDEDSAVSNYSIEIGKLSNNEVEALLSRAIPREIDVESEEYNLIVDTIAEKSEGLPLYIHFIVQKLKEIKNSKNLAKEIIEWAKKLPQKLENFYQETFKSVEPLAREILYMAYLSRTGIDINTLYDVLAEENSMIDEVLFEQKYFNDIEIFLKYDASGDYIFYHLSVKEAILEYQKNQQSMLTFEQDKLDSVLLPTLILHYGDKINALQYIKDKSTIYKVLSKSVEHFKNYKNSTYAKKNFLHLYNTQVWTHIYHNLISYDDMKHAKYDSITSAQLSKENKKEINSFFTELDTKETEKLQYEIRYGYELAFLTQDYAHVLKYKDDYENSINELFLEIALNIDKIENIEKFVMYKDDWSSSINPELQDVFIDIIAQQESLDDSFYNVMLFLSDAHREQLIFKHSDETVLKIVEILSSYSKKSKILAILASREASQELFEKSLEAVNGISEDKYKFYALEFIFTKTIDKKSFAIALEIVKNMSNDSIYENAKGKALVMLTSLTDDTDLLNQVLQSTRELEHAINRAEVLAPLSLKLSDMTLLDEALEIVGKDNICDSSSKFLLPIITTINDEDKAFEIVSYIDDYNQKSALKIAFSKMHDLAKAYDMMKKDINFNAELYTELLELVIANYDTPELTQLMDDETYLAFPPELKRFISLKLNSVERIDDIDKALEVANSIDNDYYKEEALVGLIDKTDDIDKALEIACSLTYEEIKVNALKLIMVKIHDNKTLTTIMKIAENMQDDRSKMLLLTALVSYIDDKERLKKILEMSIESSYSWAQFDIISAVLSRSQEKEILECTLKVATHIERLFEDKDKANSLIKIASHTDDLMLFHEVLDIAKTMEDKLRIARVVSFIASKTKNRDLLKKALSISSNIFEETNKVKFLHSIISKVDNIDDALELVGHFQEELGDKSQALVVLAKKYNDDASIDKLLKVVFSIKNQFGQVKTVRNIASVSTNPKALNVAWKFAKSIYGEVDKPYVLEEIALRKEDFAEALEIARELPDSNKYRVLLVLLSKVDDEDYLNQILEIVKAMQDDSYISELLACIAFKQNNLELLEMSFSMIDSIPDRSVQASILGSIAPKADVKHLNLILNKVKKISDTWKKSEVFASIASEHEDAHIAKQILKYTFYYPHQAQALTAIASKTNDKELFSEALKMIKGIVNNARKLESLLSLVERTDDKELISIALEIAISLPNNEARFKVINIIKSKSDIVDNLLFKELFNSQTEVLETMEMVCELSYKDILKYYEISLQESEEISRLQILKSLLVELHESNDDKKEQRKAFNGIKNQILEDGSLLEEFITLYGDGLEIDDYESFDDEFSFKEFDKIINYIK
jgi:sulfur transfer protein SufE